MTELTCASLRWAWHHRAQRTAGVAVSVARRASRLRRGSLNRFLVAALGLGLLSAPSGIAAPLDALVRDGDLWTLSPKEFTETYRAFGCRWTSRAKTECRSVKPGVFAETIKACELLVRFDNKKVDEVLISLYNRGDAGAISQEAFNAMGGKASALISRHTDTRPRRIGRMRATGIRRQGLEWEKPPTVYQLEWAVSTQAGNGERAEYLRLRMRPYAKAGGALGDMVRPPTPLELRQRVVKRDNGDVLVPNVPMVDQGQKGYCAVAVTERLLRYLGKRVDQHELAQLAGTGKRGTDPNSLEDALRRFAGHYNISVRAIEEFDMDALEDLVRDYNREAKRADAREIQLPEAGTVYIDQVYAAMRTGLFLAARGRDRTGRRNFRSDITQSVDRGLPLVWSVILGKVREKEIPQAAGGHMRLIIGYNRKEGELLYSDSWGRGHEEKRMALDDAWAITTNLYAIKPR